MAKKRITYSESSWRVSWYTQFRVFLSVHPWTPFLHSQTSSQCHTKASSYHWVSKSWYKELIPRHLFLTCYCLGKSWEKQRESCQRTFAHISFHSELLQHQGMIRSIRSLLNTVYQDLCVLLRHFLIWDHCEHILVYGVAGVFRSTDKWWKVKRGTLLIGWSIRIWCFN